LLGENEEYEPLSRAAYYKAMQNETIKDFDVDSEKVIKK
jgi:thymidine kinase